MADDEDTSTTPETFRGPDAAVNTYLSDEVRTVEPTATVRDVARLLLDAGVGCVVVGSRDDVLAVVSERDVLRAVAEGIDLDSVTAIEVGTRSLVWASIDDTVGGVAEEMMEDYVRHVLVRDEAGLVGILSMRDVVGAFLI